MYTKIIFSFFSAPLDEDERYINLVSSADYHEDILDTDSVPPMVQIESARSARTKNRELQERRLEESWLSLNLFEKSQKGRLSIDMESKLI